MTNNLHLGRTYRSIWGRGAITVQQSAWCKNVLVMYMWLHQTLVQISSGLFSWMSLLLGWELMPHRPALSTNILLLVKISCCRHKILDALQIVCRFNHLSASFSCNLYSHIHIFHGEFSLCLNAWFGSACERVCVDQVHLCKLCMYMISVSELHRGCVMCAKPVNWG